MCIWKVIKNIESLLSLVFMFLGFFFSKNSSFRTKILLNFLDILMLSQLVHINKTILDMSLIQ